MGWLVAKALIAGATVAVVSELAARTPRLGAFLLTLPMVSILAILMTWSQNQDLSSVSRFCRETLVLVPLGLPFFLPLAFADRLGLGFWPGFLAGFLLASGTIGLWLWLGPNRF